ncbi:MAG TPA: hypothetical protein VFQ60_05505, partial [Patescibacteria group bacterium]|nr:hypothetical protein [Patescibacteria group bacterium]
QKVAFFKAHPQIRFSNFGTRRACCRDFLHYVDATFKRELSANQFLGTSCLLSAMENDLAPVGTVSHQPFIVAQAIAEQTREGLIASQRKVLDCLEAEFGPALGIFLPDTFTTDFFMNHVLTEDRARRWRGYRTDSEDPVISGRRWHAYYTTHGIDPKTKLGIPSDSLNSDLVARVDREVGSLIPQSYGIGTFLTDDSSISCPLSIVIKPKRANGFECVKISDEPMKAMGHPDAVARVKGLIGYRSNRYEAHPENLRS